LAIRDGFAGKYARSRQHQADIWSDQLLEIADNGQLEPNDRRVRIDTRKWLMAKLHPRQWGDKTILSGDPDAPLVVGTVALDHLSDVELAALERFADARLAAKDVEHQDVSTSDS
jgi:hypothetical protein